MFVRLLLARVAAFLLLALALGCSKGNNGSFATVSGTVMHNGSPVEGARVEFHSTTESADGKRDSYATTTDSSGKYVISSVGKNPGIPPGMYKVVITKLNTKGTNAPTKEEMDPAQLEAAASASGSTPGGVVNFLPKEYGSFSTTKLSATLDSGKNENVNFDLKGK